jgi:hypothetical protein
MLFDEVGVDWMRANAAKVWSIQDVEVAVSFAEKLPEAVTVLVDDYPISVLPLDVLMADPDVASVVGRLGEGGLRAQDGGGGGFL